MTVDALGVGVGVGRIFHYSNNFIHSRVTQLLILVLEEHFIKFQISVPSQPP